jgi:hypothetical protein
MVHAGFAKHPRHLGWESPIEAKSQAVPSRENQSPVEREVRPRSKQGQYFARQASQMVTNKGLGILFRRTTD